MKCNNPLHGKSCTCKVKECPDCGRVMAIPYHPPTSKVRNR